ncbi:MAG: heme-copper oxidase subunit III [Ideonella sp.]|nr:heme-copper oxidase subunit III [Ideonella sp.]MCC7459189.1 heme-copper oxidase subunit III [Nitrospira sp.]
MGHVVSAAELAPDEALPAHSAAHGAHWETSPWPLVCALGVLLLIPLPFTLHFVYQQSLAAALCLGVGVPVTVWGIAGWTREALGGHGEGLILPAMGWFILAEALIFVGFFAAYWLMRLTAPAWPPAGSVAMPKVIPAVMTVLLIASSFTYHAAESAYEARAYDGFRRWLLVTMLLGAAFVALSGYEWKYLMGQGFGFGANVYSTAFFSITGFHAAHVLVGLGIFAAVLLPALAGRTNPYFVAAAGIYWHFVDVVWLFVVTQLYYW